MTPPGTAGDVWDVSGKSLRPFSGSGKEGPADRPALASAAHLLVKVALETLARDCGYELGPPTLPPLEAP